MRDIAEKDWKHFRSLRDNILNRFSKETLSNIHQIMADKAIETKHGKYLKVYEYIQKRDKILATQLSDFRRSTAKLKISELYHFGFIKPDEFSQFSDDLKNFVKGGK